MVVGIVILFVLLSVTILLYVRLCLLKSLPVAQQIPVQQVLPVVVESSVPVESKDITQSSPIMCYRSHMGHVLKSTDDCRKDIEESKQKEHESNSECSQRDDSLDIESTILPDNGTNANNLESSPSIQMCVDFGDFEVLPLDELSCPICLIEYEHGDIVQRSACNGYNQCSKSDAKKSVELQCEHIFHTNCISKWMKTTGHDECPMCRRLFVMDR